MLERTQAAVATAVNCVVAASTPLPDWAWLVLVVLAVMLFLGKDALKISTGQKSSASGLYQCKRCGEKITARAGKRMPPCKCGGTDWTATETTTKTRKKRRVL
jgi:hypothetical protein